MRQTIWCILAAALAFGPVALGQQITVDFDPAATKIEWSLSGTVHTVHGTFQLKQGHVSLDTANGNMSGELVVDSGSGESGSGARDKRMKKEVLETEKYPEIRLKVAKLEGPLTQEGSSNLRILGQLTIHGKSHEVSIPFQVTTAGAQFTGKGKLSIPYVDWGMKDPSNFLLKVDKSVEIDVAAAGRIAH